jgi:hypothetical protein
MIFFPSPAHIYPYLSELHDAWTRWQKRVRRMWVIILILLLLLLLPLAAGFGGGGGAGGGWRCGWWMAVRVVDGGAGGRGAAPRFRRLPLAGRRGGEADRRGAGAGAAGHRPARRPDPGDGARRVD